MTHIKTFMILVIGALLLLGCQTEDPFVKEWQRRKRLIIKTKELYPIKGVPEQVEWHMPKSIVVSGDRLELVREDRRYNLIDERGELKKKKRISIFVNTESNHAKLIDRTAWRYANSTSAPYDDEELIRHVRVYHDGEYVIFPRGLGVEVLYSNLIIGVLIAYEDYTEDYDAVEVAKAILEAGLVN